MRRYYASSAVAAVDGLLTRRGFSGRELMENAGAAIVHSMRHRWPDGPGGQTVVLLGPGNNGGDGLVVARLLALEGWNVCILSAVPIERLRGDGAANFARLPESADVLQANSLSDAELADLFERSTLVVDGLLGTGSTGAPRGQVKRLIELTNRSRAFVWSIDLPSGLESDEGPWIEADATTSLAGLKAATATGRRRTSCGALALRDLGADEGQLLSEPLLSGFEARDVEPLLPRRQAWDHKGSRGGVLILAGSERYRGAALLAARGALRGGAGLAVVASVPSVLDGLAVVLPEAIGEPLGPEDDPTAVLERWRDRCGVLVVGPGLDRDERAWRIARAVAADGRLQVWDGDGLFFLKDMTVHGRVCVTPHEGEAAHLLGGWNFCPEDGRRRAAAELTRRWDAVLLKGPGTLVAGVGQPLRVVEAGGRGLAIPGSGDVLSGLCGAMLTSGLNTLDGLTAAAWLHGRAGDRLSDRIGPDGLLAREVADEVPLVLREFSS